MAELTGKPRPKLLRRAHHRATQMKVEFLDTYKAQPPVPTVKKNDLAVLVSFVYKFD